MHLYLSSQDPRNSTYSTEDGKVVYRVTTPFTFTNLTSTIERALPDIPGKASSSDSFGFLAAVEHRQISPARIRYGGKEFSVDDFFSKKSTGWLDLGSRRVFTGPDGKEYYWKYGNTKSELYLNDGSKTLVAKPHRKHFGIFTDKKPASLEILPEGEHMMDLILITFTYIDKLRQDRATAISASNAAAASSGAAAASVA